MQDQFNQAQHCHQSGQLSQAEAIYRELHASEPLQAMVNLRLAQLLQQTNRQAEALPFIRVAIDGMPGQLELLLLGVSISTQLGDNKTAETWLRRAVQIQPDNIKVNEQLAGVLISNYKEKDALEACKRLIKLDPKNANGYNLKGLALSRMGETDKGYKCFQKSVRMNPGHIAVIRNLILYGKGKKEPLLASLIPQLEQNIAKNNQPVAVQMNMAYIISMYYERQKNTDKAFQYLKLGNDLNRQTSPYQQALTDEQFQLLANAFDESFKQEFKGRGIDDSAPIFILGMPRSGTTLVEQILSSHSRVEAEGEIVDLRNQFEKRQQIVDSDISTDDKVQACIDVAQAYVGDVKARRSAEFFTDKMPYNFMLVGLIALAMPHAKIIHCTRDPLETCFSIYKQNFAGSHAYTNNMAELGQYYKSYEALMSHWLDLFGAQIHEVNYEKMVENSEQEINGLLAYCRLSEEPACYEFHKNKRAVRTASVAQVRQPIYKDAMKASAPYEKHLAPLIAALQSN
jgi:tetratricopeptide (TPR) repeat protein